MTSEVANFMKKYTFNYKLSKSSSFAKIYFKSHLAACIEFEAAANAAKIVRVAQLNNFEVQNAVSRACQFIDKDEMLLEVDHDLHSASDFTS